LGWEKSGIGGEPGKKPRQDARGREGVVRKKREYKERGERTTDFLPVISGTDEG